MKLSVLLGVVVFLVLVLLNGVVNLEVVDWFPCVGGPFCSTLIGVGWVKSSECRTRWWGFYLRRNPKMVALCTIKSGLGWQESWVSSLGQCAAGNWLPPCSLLWTVRFFCEKTLWLCGALLDSLSLERPLPHEKNKHAYIVERLTREKPPSDNSDRFQVKLPCPYSLLSSDFEMW